VRQNPGQKLNVGGSSFPGKQAPAARLFDGLPHRVNPVRAEAGQRIGHAFGPAATPQQALADFAGPASSPRRLFRQRCVGTDNVCTRLDPLQHSGEMFWIVAEIGLQRNDHVALWIIGPAGGFPEQQFERTRVATPAIEMQHA
jgi:hypothetical protein